MSKSKADAFNLVNDLQLQIHRADVMLALMKAVVDPDNGPEDVQEHRRALELLCDDVRGVLDGTNKMIDDLFQIARKGV
jgi:hypothetical protein